MLSSSIKLMIYKLLVILIACQLVACHRPQLAALPGAAEGGRISFNASIQPILSENCYHCHGPDSGTRQPEKEPLRLDREKFAFAKREDGNPVMIKGDPGASLLVRLMKSHNPEEIMPPPESHKVLTPQQIATVERWVKEGAVYEEHWSFIPPQRASVPVTKHPEKVKSPVDAFIQERLLKQGIALAAVEEPRVLIRRVTLDLTGLLPVPAEVEAFVKDPSAAAYSAYLEKLFRSPAYAEHRTRYWLDYSRYADTHGLHYDNLRSIWPYRDYVIRSFAANKPYDQFVREQLAGDLIPANSADSWIATGYIRCNVSTNEGGAIPEEIHANNTRDRTEAFSAAFLGLTIGCAACHDHKFDPTGQRDFYSLGAFFNNTAEKAWDENIADSPPVLRVPPDDQRPEFDAAVVRRSQAAQAYAQRRASAASLFKQWLAAGKKPEAVSSTALELRLRLDEGTGEVVKNSAPAASPPFYTADTNPLIWGENIWFWPSMRMDISTNLRFPGLGDFEADQGFSASMWTLLRVKPSDTTTGNGALISRMGDASMGANRGWDMFIEDEKLVVHIVQQWPAHAISVETTGIPRGEWVHLGFTYDGSGKAAGVKLFVNGQVRTTHWSNDTLEAGLTIRNSLPLNLGQRVGSERLKESAYQDVRLYHRQLQPTEFARLPYEDPSAEILAASPDPEQWSPRQQMVALDRFFLSSIDPEALKLQKLIATADVEIDRLGKDGAATLIAREQPIPAAAWVLKRGVYSARKELVSPATPDFLPAPHQASNRLELAEWLFKPENPLFARVTVNRIWQELFGIGLVETSDDFGIMGTRASNQELLDWLAVEFRESGWDVKHIYQLLVTSNTYCQSNQVTAEALAADPANRLLSRGPRFRMDAEMLRDSALQAAGLLAAKIGGPSVKPYQPEGIWESVSMPDSNTLHYEQDAGESLYRRSLYSFWKRFAPPPSLETFDAQAREVVCVRRARTNTPLQALVSMNDPQFFEAARKLAERAITHGSSIPERLDFLATTLISRPLAAPEIAGLTRSLGGYSKYYTENPQAATALLTTGAAPTNPDLKPVEIATWAMMANQLLNLDETLTK